MSTNSKHIHLIGICGTAMASLAGMLRERGHRVTGSDAAAYPPMSTFLESLGIPVAQPFAEKNLDPRPDLVVVGNALSRGNVELERVLDERIPFCSLPQILHDEFLVGKEVLVVAGTHGKTTTTSMLAWIFESAGLQPSFLIGGIAENFGSSFGLGSGKHFILEGDEYDTAFFDKGPKFLHYFPDGLILTSVEFDHADIYKDLDAVETAFKRLVNLIPRRGRIVAFDGGATGSASLERCLAKAFCPVERYGASDRAAWQITNLKARVRAHNLVRSARREVLGRFFFRARRRIQRLERNRRGRARHKLRCPERCHRASSINLPQRKASPRSESRSEWHHHHRRLRASSNRDRADDSRSARALRRAARLWVVLEPRSNTMRRNVLQDALAASLALADEVVLAAIFKSEAIPEVERLDINRVVSAIQARGKRVRIFPDADAIVTRHGARTALARRSRDPFQWRIRRHL